MNERSEPSELIETFRPLLDAAGDLDLSEPTGARAELERRFDPASDSAAALRAELVALLEQGKIAQNGELPVRWGRVAKASDETSDLSIDVVHMNGAGPRHPASQRPAPPLHARRLTPSPPCPVETADPVRAAVPVSPCAGYQWPSLRAILAGSIVQSPMRGASAFSVGTPENAQQMRISSGNEDNRSPPSKPAEGSLKGGGRGASAEAVGWSHLSARLALHRVEDQVCRLQRPTEVPLACPNRRDL